MSSGRFFEPGRHHDIWKEWRRIGKGREDRFFLEHRQAVLESLTGQHPPLQVLLARELHGSDPRYWDGLAQAHPLVAWFLIDGKSLDEVASVPANSGLCGVFCPREATLQSLFDRSLLLLVWELADPGNLGTLLRSCQALAEGGGLLTVGGCSPWSAKVARASAGALLKLPLVQLSVEQSAHALSSLSEAGFALHGAFPRAGLALQDVAWTGKDVVLLGNETRGLPSELRQKSLPFSIPMSSDAESLNVAVTGSVVAWEWKRWVANSPSAGLDRGGGKGSSSG